MILWHCTRLNLIEKILKEGLKTKSPEQRNSKVKGIYLSEYRFNWMWNTTREGKFKGATLKIDVTNLSLMEDYHDDPRDTLNNSKQIRKDFICLCNIPPKRIKEVWIEKGINSFHKIAKLEILK